MIALVATQAAALDAWGANNNNQHKHTSTANDTNNDGTHFDSKQQTI